MIPDRIYERDTDKVFIEAFRRDSKFAAAVAAMVASQICSDLPTVYGQTRHAGHSGTIDIDVEYRSGLRLLIENKIDAGYSLTLAGDRQPERYQQTVLSYRANQVNAWSVLLAPKIYLEATRAGAMFNCCVSYEELLNYFDGPDLATLRRAIDQAAAPYEAVANVLTGNFFDAFRAFAALHFPSLALKRDPNAEGIRPTDSRTFYFDVGRTLVAHSGIPKPRMSLQCWDKNAPSASVKIMIGNWGKYGDRLSTSNSLHDAGVYLRRAGQSLGLVVDTPRLDTQSAFDDQVDAVAAGLDGAMRLQGWWNGNRMQLLQWASEIAISAMR